jgi:hypothetical protein
VVGGGQGAELVELACERVEGSHVVIEEASLAIGRESGGTDEGREHLTGHLQHDPHRCREGTDGVAVVSGEQRLDLTLAERTHGSSVPALTRGPASSEIEVVPDRVLAGRR